ncbi:MAG: SDR family oxidoreductase [Gemmatimonadota bacterium]|nr:SDR family oxidoreductase [Gemmatimonadota bacterium]
MAPDKPIDRVVLLTGATGYVGGRLLPVLEDPGRRVRCLVRDPARLTDVAEGTEVVRGDVFEPASLERALSGVHTAYYMIHSMGSAEGFEERDRRAAENFAEAARGCGVRRLIYLGGLGHGDELSPHLRSRQEVGRILRASGVPTLEFRASIIIGSGSLSFEMIRALVEKLPIMITPRWVRQKAQPLAIEDLIDYLVEALDLPLPESRIFEIGGADPVSYGDIMREYARQRGLRRPMIPVPVLTPHLSSLWLGLVTPVYARVGRKLLDGVRNPTVVRDTSALEAFDVEPRGIAEAIGRALVHEDHAFAQTRWSDALSSAGPVHTVSPEELGPRIVDSRVADVPVRPAAAFRPIRRIGGRVGWYWGDSLWHLRGFLDLLVGGVGMRRGRRDPERLAVGDALDFWRVEAYEENRLLRLRAEMKLPGRAWLQFEVTPEGDSSCIRQTAVFDPLGLFGRLYWYALYPLHQLIFRRMLQRIADAARSAEPETAAA